MLRRIIQRTVALYMSAPVCSRSLSRSINLVTTTRRMSSDRSVPTRQRLVISAAELFRRHGYAATGIKAILTAADATYGSLYHFFPGGKAELGRAVVERGRRGVPRARAGVLPRPTSTPSRPPSSSSPTGSTSSSPPPSPTPAPSPRSPARSPTPTTSCASPRRRRSQSWIDALSANLVHHGADATTAAATGVELFCLIEGAFLLCRTTRSAEPLRIAGTRAVAVVAESLAERRARVPELS